MDTQMAYMPFLFGGILVAMLAAAFIYAKGYEGGSGLMEGARCGAALGVFAAGYAGIIATRSRTSAGRWPASSRPPTSSSGSSTES
jgi:hypothetical protein